MKHNKLVAFGLIGSIAIAGLTGIFDESLAYATTESLYQLSGLGMVVFGIWASVILLKQK